MKVGIFVGAMAVLVLMMGAGAGVAQVPTGSAVPLGAAGSLTKVVITGIPPETAGALRAGLQGDGALQRLATPSGAQGPFLKMLEEAARLALLRDGRRDVQAVATREGDRVTLRIDGGAQYVAGKVVVEVPAGLSAEAIRAAVTDAPPVNSRRNISFDGDNIVVSLTDVANTSRPWALWHPENPPPFDAPYLKRINSAVAQAVREQGFGKAAIDCGYAVDPPGTANLKITIRDLGPRMKLSKIDIGGSFANSRADVLALLGLEPGQPIDLRTLKTAFDKLYNSGRFIRHSLILTPLDDGAAALTVDLQDAEGVPPLATPLSEADSALLRMRGWAEQFDRQTDDMTADLNLSVAHLQFIVSPTEGFVGRFDATAAARGMDGFTSSLLVARAGVGLRLGGGGAVNRYLAEVPPTVGLLMYMVLKPRDLSFGSGISQNSGGNAAPLTLQMTLPPAIVLAATHTDRIKAEVSDNVLQVAWGGVHLTADARTGAIKEITGGGTDGAVSSHITFSKGALARAIDEIRNDPAPNQHDPRHTLGSGIRFVAMAAILNPLQGSGTLQQRQAAAAVAGSLFNEDMYTSLDEYVAEVRQGFDSSVPRSDLAEVGGAAFLGHYAAPLYEYGTFPWVILRRRFLFGDQPDAAETRHLYEDPGLGPLGCLLMAEWAGNATTAGEFAQLGRRRMTPEALAADLKVLLGGDAPMPRMTRALLTHFRDLKPEDVQTLAAVLPKNEAPLLGVLHRALQLHKDRAIEGQIPELAATLFPGIRQELDANLDLFVPPEIPDLDIAPPK